MIPTGLVIPPATGSTGSAFSIRSAIAKAIAEVVPDGHTGAAAVIVAADGSVHAVIASKFADGRWSVAGSLDHDGHHLSGQVMLAGSW